MVVRASWTVVAALGLAGAVALGCGGKSTTIEGGSGAGSGGTDSGVGGGSAAGGRGGKSATGGTGGGATGGSGGDSAGGTGGDFTGGSGRSTADGGTVGATGGKGGSDASGGTGGSVDPNAKATKLDLLLMIDNSMSMFQKQQIFASSLPYLLDGLTNDLGVEDLHVGVITSSIGDHGSGDVCSPASSTAENHYDDLAQLIPSVRSGLSSYEQQGFLLWDPRASATPPGEPDVVTFTDALVDHVLASSEGGCGFEASLEAWYRFLIDPEPISVMMNDGDPGTGRAPVLGVRGPVNETVLAQRAAFLRPDSAVVVLMLTDENDCSILDEDATQGWLVPFKGGINANSWRMPRAHAICTTNPNDRGCQPCGSGDSDPACDQGQSLGIVEDAPNLRCFKQKQRFGIDLLYPLSRYVDGLTKTQIDPRFTGDRVQNPLFAEGRSPSLVFLMGILGVPWQDLATEDSWSGEGLDYLTAAELESEGRWPMITGDVDNGVNPSDLLMVESVDPRPSGDHPLLGPSAAPAPPESTDSTANPINGHEQQVIPSERADLQFACIFELEEPVPCGMANEGACDCNADEFAKNSPLCDYPTPEVDGTQHFGKAYPSLRGLTVLQRLGNQGVTASICPKALAGGASDPSYGYNPATRALTKRLRSVLAP